MQLPVNLFKALADATRLRTLSLLQAEDELCVCDIISTLKLPQSTVSRHLAYLRKAGWVTLPEATPVHEALALQKDLRRAGIEPAGWIVNQSLAPHIVKDPVLQHRRAREFRYIEEVVREGLPTFLIHWQLQQ